jgi:hypothetical protein
VEKSSTGYGFRVLSFNSPWCFLSTKHGSSVSARSLIHRVHAVYICVPVTILDPLCYIFKFISILNF